MLGWNEVLIQGCGYDISAVTRGECVSPWGLACSLGIQLSHTLKCKVVIAAMACSICVILHRFIKNFKNILLLLQKACEAQYPSRKYMIGLR